MSAGPVAFSTRSFQFEASTQDSRTLVTCRGRLTFKVADRFASDLKDFIAGGKALEVDCQEVQFVDSAGLGALVLLYRSARAAGCGFRLLNLNSQVIELLRITNLDKILQGCCS